MTMQKVTVKVTTPTWQYCDLQNPVNRKCKSGERCRFCKEVKKRGQSPQYFCLLFNNELTCKNGAVEKTTLCYSRWKDNQIIDLTAEPAGMSTDISPKDAVKMVKTSLKDVKRRAKQLYNQGLPMEQAYDMAIAQTEEQWRR